MPAWIHYARLALFFVVMLHSVTATAQSEWAVVPYGHGKLDQAERAAESVVRALLDRQVSVLSLHETRDRMVARSREPNETTAEDRTRIREATGRAIEHAAYGRRSEARNEARAVLSIAERSMETLNRESNHARLVLDACLTLVRVDLQAKDRASALEQAKRCRRLVPDLLPKESTHPAEVIGALAEADNQLRRAGAAELTVQTPGESCPIFMNGRRVGTTPFQVEGSSPGEWRVQVECGSDISRIHPVTLGSKPITLTIDAKRDQRIDDRDILALRYASEADEREALAGDARALAEDLNVSQLVLVRARGAGDALLVRWDRKRARVVATASLLLDDRGIESLLREEKVEGVPEGFATAGATADQGPAAHQPEGEAVPDDGATKATAESPSPDASEQDTDLQPSDSPSSQRRIWTWVLGGASVAAAGAAIATGFAARAKVDEYKNCETKCGAIKNDGERLQLITNVTFGAAGALLTGAVVAFFLERPDAPAPSTTMILGPEGVTLVGRF